MSATDRGAGDGADRPEGASRRRRTPTQRRSRERMEAILAAAHALVVERGSDAVKMSDVASRAGVPIGSLYQYFPDKPAVLRELALRFMARTRATLAEGLAGVVDREDALARVDALLDGYYRLFLDEPDTRDIWAATQSDKALQELDVQDSRANGDLIAGALQHLVPEERQEALRDSAFLLAHLTGATTRLAVVVGREEGDRLMAQYRQVALGQLGRALGG